MILLIIFFGCIFGSTVGQRATENNSRNPGANGTDWASSLASVMQNLFYSSGYCTLPWYAGINSYTKVNCVLNCLIQPGAAVPNNEIVRVNCNPGYGPPSNTPYDAYYTCVSGKWFYKEPECVKLCPELVKKHLKIECSYGLEPVSCYNYMRPGTVAKFRCDEFYRASYDTFSYSDRATCLNGGTWSERLPTCSLVCGMVNQVNNVEATLVRANKTTYGEYPWHVAIYTNVANRYEYICGGSLVAENFVLTAAHCMFNPNAYYTAFTISSLKVAVGKGKRDYYIQERYQVNSDVVNIIIPETYVGDGTRYAEDIALLETEVSFVFNHFVLPVCLDRFGVVKFQEDTKGIIAGWGRTENGTLSDDLREVRLPIMPIVQCRQMFPEFIQFLTTDKYCVIHQNGSGIDMGDSGGGMTFDRFGQHYIRGIVSIKRTDSTLFSAFTNVSTYMQWIYDSMRSRNVPVTVDKICENWKRNQICKKNNPVALANQKVSVAKPRLYKYMAFIARSDPIDPRTYTIQCSGALISERWVLTAGCIYGDVDGNTYAPEWVILGDLHVYTGSDDARPQTRSVIDIVLHPDYGSYEPYVASPLSPLQYLPHLLALLKLDSPVVFDEYVAPACLHTSDEIPVDKVVLTGWGYVWLNDSYVALPYSMLVAESPVNNISRRIRPKKRVNSSAERLTSFKHPITAGMFYSSPMAYTLDGGCTWTLTGLVEDLYACDTANMTTCKMRPVSSINHARVFDYLSWIKSIVWPDT
ncbi:hypothetical protein O3M35_006859 [Rhynocoris fuscipes]|uniref:Uncharacterized protein n=1 Tax=Rhynocoris fuscipes TaxID=488301 RepID=A0AAW1DEW1_9HEMI